MTRLAKSFAHLCVLIPAVSFAADPPKHPGGARDRAAPATRAAQYARAIPAGSEDLLASVSQSAVDKVLDSATYPLVVFTYRNDDVPRSFAPARRDAAARSVSREVSATLSDDAVNRLLSAAAKVRGRGSEPKRAAPASARGEDAERAWAEENLSRSVAAGTDALLAQARALLSTSDDSEPARQIKAKIDEFARSGIANMVGSRGFRFRAILRTFTLAVAERPTLALVAKEIAVGNLETLASFGAELYWYHPVPGFDFPWNWPWKWDVLASAGLNDVRFDAAAKVSFAVDYTRVDAVATCERLRLDYAIIREIPLEGLVNGYLTAHPVPAFDAGPMLVTLPLLGKTFRIAEADLQVANGRMTVPIRIVEAGGGPGPAEARP